MPRTQVKGHDIETTSFETKVETAVQTGAVSDDVVHKNGDTMTGTLNVPTVNITSVNPADTATFFGTDDSGNSTLHVRIGNGTGDKIQFESWNGNAATSLMEIGQTTVTIKGDLNVTGTTTTINSTTLEVGDNFIILNSGVTGAPVLDAGITIERGTSADAVFKWNETEDKWEASDGLISDGYFRTSDSVRIRYIDNSYYGWIGFYRQDDTRGAYIGWGNGNDRVDLILDNASIFSIQGGKVGIGVTTPGTILEAKDTINDPRIRLSSSIGAVGEWGYNSTDDTLELTRWYGSQYSALAIERTTGNVGIGGTTAYSRLSVNDGRLTIISDYYGGTYVPRDTYQDSHEILRAVGSTSDFIMAIQDGTGRASFYWNARPGLSPKFLVDNENAVKILFTPDDENKIFSIQWADGNGKSAGDDITWNEKLKLAADGVLRTKALYNIAADEALRSTTASNWTTENNLSVSLDVKTNDIVEVSLEGRFRNDTSTKGIIAKIELDSGSADLLTPISNPIYFADGYYWKTAYTTRLYKATANTTLVFKMVWYAYGGGTAYCDQRVMMAKLIGTDI